MPVFVLAVVGAIFLLVRRTWKASKKRHDPVGIDPEPEAQEDGI